MKFPTDLTNWRKRDDGLWIKNGVWRLYYERICDTCGERMLADKSHADRNSNWGKYCSHYCVPHAKGEAARGWKDDKYCERICNRCGKKMLVGKSYANRYPDWGKYCSRECANNKRKLPGYPHSHGYAVCGGYMMINMPGHPHANCLGYVGEHKLVMEKKLGRFPTSDEVVHHINGDKADNGFGNLFLMKRDRHFELHGILRQCNALTGLYV